MHSPKSFSSWPVCDSIRSPSVLTRAMGIAGVVAALAMGLVIRPLTAEETRERPNIVLLISDDQDYEHLGFMGNSFVHTPNLDRLARAGTVFTTAHLPMSRCHPTLASFLSGRWPHQSGIYYNYGKKKLAPDNSLPNLLRQAGYATYVEGKYWEGNPREMGFTHGKGKTAGTFVRKTQESLFAFIDAHAGKQPMFIWWAPKLPHTPHNPPQRYRALYDAKQMPIPPYMRGRVDHIPMRPDLPRRQRRGFRDLEMTSYAMDAWLDDGVGQLIDKMRSAGEHERTLYVFVIDNGWCNGLVSKGSPFEKGVRTPIFFSWPKKIAAGRRFDDLVSTLDLYPTILDYAGVEVPTTAAGRSLRPRIEGRPAESREYLFGAIYPAFATRDDQRPERDVYALYCRTRRWKYILYVQDVTADRNRNYFRIQHILTEFPTRQAGDEDLYDLQRDPYELKDLADQPDQRRRMDELRRRVLAWWKETGGGPLPYFEKRSEDR